MYNESVHCVHAGSWLLVSELFPAYIKGRAIAVTTCFNWTTNLLVSITFLDFVCKSLPTVATSLTAFACLLSFLLT